MAYTVTKTPPYPETGTAADEWDINEWRRIYDAVVDDVNDGLGVVVMYFTDGSKGTALADVLEEIFQGYRPEEIRQAVDEAIARQD